MKIYDVGGQRSLRNAWVSFFDDVNAIVFVAAISCYDLLMEEDKETNRMEDSVKLFGVIANHPMLAKSQIILFLNKMDIFKEKIKTVPIHKYFPAFQGEQDEKACKSFFKNLFVQSTTREMKYIFYTTNTDSQIMKKILLSVRNKNQLLNEKDIEMLRYYSVRELEGLKLQEIKNKFNKRINENLRQVFRNHQDFEEDLVEIDDEDANLSDDQIFNVFDDDIEAE
ncbi:guanine nucleotide-binding protein subunit alpha [Lobulomyces angularis]|nr:guanine nucleotide-binding protein subunit alpha [Lobulomyces angularis]